MLHLIKKSERYNPFPELVAPEIALGTACKTPVVIVGMGPVGLVAAIDLAQKGIASVVIQKHHAVSDGSRAICWAKRSLEICDRLGVGEIMVQKGVTWKIGRTYLGDEEIFNFDLLPEDGHKKPAFINLQQYYVEHFLIQRCQQLSEFVDLRFGTELVNFTQDGSSVTLDVENHADNYQIIADYMLACDGADSKARRLMNLDFKGVRFKEKFLIADIEMEAPFPAERRFWFKPKFHHGQSSLLHKQPDNIYRIDFQLPADADGILEVQPEKVSSRIEKMLGHRNFKLDWVSLYRFGCRRIEKFIHDRVIFVGDSAHTVSPFGARGGNGGLQDADNLCWKLALVIQGKANKNLLETYNEERTHGSDENIAYSSNTTNFMSPRAGMAMQFRDAVLDLAKQYPFARQLINGGRLSTPCNLAQHKLQRYGFDASDATNDNMTTKIGIVCPDAPLNDNAGKPCWLSELVGEEFTLLVVGDTDNHADINDALKACNEILPVKLVAINGRDYNNAYSDNGGFVKQRYGAGIYLVRPDQHIIAFWESAVNVVKISETLQDIITVA